MWWTWKHWAQGTHRRWRRKLRRLPLPLETVHRALELWDAGDVREMIDTIELSLSGLDDRDRRAVERFCKKARRVWTRICLRALLRCRGVAESSWLAVEVAAWQLWMGQPARARQTLQQAQRQYPKAVAVHRALAQMGSAGTADHDDTDLALQALQAGEDSVEMATDEFVRDLLRVARQYVAHGAIRHARRHAQLAHLLCPDETETISLLERLPPAEESAQDRKLDQQIERGTPLSAADTAPDADGQHPAPAALNSRLEALGALQSVRGYALLDGQRIAISRGLAQGSFDSVCHSAREVADEAAGAASAMRLGRLQTIQIEGRTGALHGTLLPRGLLLALADRAGDLERWEDLTSAAVHAEGATGPTDSHGSPAPRPPEARINSLLKERGVQAAAVFDHTSDLTAEAGQWPSHPKEIGDSIDEIMQQAKEACEKMGLGLLLTGEFSTPRHSVQVMKSEAGQTICLCDPLCDPARLEARIADYFHPLTAVSEKLT